MSAIDALTGNTRAFSEACYNDCGIKELDDSLFGMADPIDCKAWKITEVEWRKAVSAALDALLEDEA